MRIRQAALVVIGLLATHAHAAFAAQLTLDQCVSQALARNSQIKSAEMQLAAAQEDVRIARTGFLPSLRARGTYSLVDAPERLIVNANAFAPGIPSQNVTLSTGDQDQYAVSLVLQQPLFTGGNLTHALRQARSRDQGARHKLEYEKRLLQFRVKRQFNEALSAQVQEGTVAKLLEAKAERLRVFRERYAEGYLEKEEVLLQETDLSFARAELSRCASRSALALSRLKQLIRQPADEALVLLGKPHNLRLVASLDEVLRAGLDNREDLKGSLEQVRAADEEVGVAKSAFYPQAFLAGSFTRQKETNIARPEVWMLTLQFDWQLFEWGRTKAQVQRATALRQGQLYEQEEMKNRAMIEIEQIWRDLKDREQEIKAQELRLKTEEYRVGRVLEKYGAGSVRLAEVLDAEAQLIKASNDYLIAINDAAALQAQLEGAVSTPISAWFVEDALYQPDLKQVGKTLHSLVDERRQQLGELSPPQAERAPGIASGSVPGDNPPRLPVTDAVTSAEGAVNSAQTTSNTHAPPPSATTETAPAASLAGPAARKAVPQAEPTKPAAAKQVFLQLGAFKSKRHADMLKKTFAAKARGHRLRVLHEGGMYKVVLGGFDTKNEAESWALRSGAPQYLARSHGGP